MGIYTKYSELRSRWPAKAVETMLVQTARPVWERIIGASLTEEEIRRRRSELPIQKADVGAVAVREGIALHDTELRRFGEAMVAKAIVDADNETNDMVVQEAVTHVGAALPIQGVKENPYVPSEMADRVVYLLNEFKNKN